MFNSIYVKRIILGAKIILIKFKLKKYRGHTSVIFVIYPKENVATCDMAEVLDYQ